MDETTIKKLCSEVLKRDITDEEILEIEAVMAEPKNHIVRYIRKPKVAMLCSIPTVDSPPEYKWRIGQGTPIATFIAFKDGEDLRIGWAKRNMDIFLVRNEAVEEFIYNMIGLKNVGQLDGANPELFSAVESFVKKATLLEREIFFSKSVGKRLAVLRAFHDELTFGKRGIKSKLSGYVPRDLVPQFRRFIQRIHKKFGITAVNVKIDS